MTETVSDKLALARTTAMSGWSALLERDDVRTGRARFVAAQKLLGEALKPPAPQSVRFELVGVLAEVSSQLGDVGTVRRCANLLPMLAPKSDASLVDSLLQRMVSRWGAPEAARQGLGVLGGLLNPRRRAAIESLIVRRLEMQRTAPLTTRQILVLKAYLAKSGVAHVSGSSVRRQGTGLTKTTEWLRQSGLAVPACLSFLGSLGGTTDASVLLELEPLEPYDVAAAWSAVAPARRLRAAERARGVRASGPASTSVSVSAPIESRSVAAMESLDEGLPTSSPSEPVPVVSSDPASPDRSDRSDRSGNDTGGRADGFVVPYEDPYGRFKGRFEDDGRAGYLYLMNRNGTRRLMPPLWVYNRVEAAVALPPGEPGEGAGPVMAGALMVSPEPRAMPVGDELELHVADDGAWIAVQLGGRLVALLDYHQRVGWSRGLREDTAHGLRWTDDLPEAL